MYLNDIEDVFNRNGVEGIDIDLVKLFLILYADDIVIFAKSSEELQKSLDGMQEYCNRWKLIVNAAKTKIMIFNSEE